MSTETAKFFQTEHIDEIFKNGVVIKDGVPLPLEIEISLVDRCTRTCDCCPRGDDSVAPHTELRMHQNLWSSLAGQLKGLGYKGLIMLSGLGECILYGDEIYDVINAFSFTYVNMNTNGDLLDRNKLEDLIEAGIHKIMISVYEKESLPKFEEMSKGLEKWVTLRKRYKEDFDRLYNNRGGAVQLAADGGYGAGETGVGICYYPFYLVMVDTNGDCYPCCHEWTRKLKIGNLYQKTFWEIWTSESLKRVRRKILGEKRDLYPCRQCNVNGTLRGGNNYELYTKLPK